MPSSYAIGDHFEQFIRKQVDGGRYASASEVVREALRVLEDRERMHFYNTHQRVQGRTNRRKQQQWMAYPMVYVPNKLFYICLYFQ